MGLTELQLEACPCARVGSKNAKLVLRTRPDIGGCDACESPIWITHAGRRSGLRLVCTECLAQGPSPSTVFMDRFRVFIRHVHKHCNGLLGTPHRVDANEAWSIACMLNPWEPPAPLEPYQDSELLPPPF